MLHFTKMHGLGNDFMVIDLITQQAKITPKLVKQWGNRHTGIGFDQLLIVEPPSRPDVDFCYRIFNADGSEVEQCGNGARCFAKFVRQKRLTHKKNIIVETKSGIIELAIQPDDQVKVNMGRPRFVPKEIPFISEQQQNYYQLLVEEQTIELSSVSMGNPHAVIQVTNLKTAPVQTLGPKIETHPHFPNRVNVGFIQVIDRYNAKLRVWERGAGETQACGTGACAAAAIAIQNGWMDSPVNIQLPGGKLIIEWDNIDNPIFMTGNAVSVYEGKIKL
ncbi:diaminopimelate epimerase [Entomomonas moraniae]|uniref:Diaminopimelate epimerase n=1 Tax=Entomomonas moraniae TaxID=2213226 RepID=A0A3S9XFZ7_9GAMM|nr:diaminopimelate epimerase [Entomomonas moraniae]AZS51347.1 diaminopimelate epimerase [Entomomonas moraniae]